MRRWMWIWTVIFQKSFAQIATIPNTNSAPILYKNKTTLNTVYFTKPSTLISSEFTQLVSGTDLFIHNFIYTKENPLHKFSMQTYTYGSPELFIASIQYGHIFKINKAINIGSQIGLIKSFPKIEGIIPEVGLFASSIFLNNPIAIIASYSKSHQKHALNYCFIFSKSNLNIGFEISTLVNYGYVQLSNKISNKFQTNIQLRTNSNYSLELIYNQKNLQLAYEIYSIRQLGFRNTIRLIYALDRQSDDDLGSLHVLPNTLSAN